MIVRFYSERNIILLTVYSVYSYKKNIYNLKIVTNDYVNLTIIIAYVLRVTGLYNMSD